MSWILADAARCSLWRSKSIDLDFENHCARTYAVMWNTLDPSLIRPVAADGIVHEAQQVLTPLVGRNKMMAYLERKMEAVRDEMDCFQVFAEIGEFQERPCIIVAQGDRENLVGVVLFEVKNGKLSRIDLCSVLPRPEQTIRTGVYPRIPSKGEANGSSGIDLPRIRT